MNIERDAAQVPPKNAYRLATTRARAEQQAAAGWPWQHHGTEQWSSDR